MVGERTLIFVLQKLKEEWREYSDLRDGERRELQQLEEDLNLLQTYLTNAANGNPISRECEKRIMTLVYEVEDTIALCLAKKAAAKAKNFVSGFFEEYSIKMAKRVKSIRRERVQPIVNEIMTQSININTGGAGASVENPHTNQARSIGQSFVTVIHNPEVSTGESSSQQGGQTSAQVQSDTQDRYVKFKDEDTIITDLMRPMDRLDVMSITGIPGIGKTTLAKRIFENENIVRAFRLRIWIRVSKKFNRKDVFLSILEHLVTGTSSIPTDPDLIQAILGCLRQKKFLLVLDDLWSVEDWKTIAQILSMDNKEGRVLVTTRVEGIASRRTYKLNGLASDACLELLKLNVFDNVQNCTPDFEVILRDIACTCGGVPLKVVLIGGALRSIYLENDSDATVAEKWGKVLENVRHVIRDDEGNLIGTALELSYDSLDHDLRHCFLYTGLFPENQEIPASTLTKLWIAEGFIQRKGGETLEETANKVLDDLIHKNLVVASKKNLDHVKTCQVHDMIRGFCLAKAVEENVFGVIKADRDGLFEPPVSAVRHFRRVGLHSNPSGFLNQNPEGELVRSFLCFLEQPSDFDPTHMLTIPDEIKLLRAFKLLRVLNCKSIKFGKFPEFKRLILLKHITISIDNLDVLPKQISKLLNLQTLIVDTNSRCIKVEANIWKMVQLMRLKTKAAILLDGKKEDSRVCEKLETMSRLSPNSCTTALFRRAPRLKKLGIRGEVASLFDTFHLNGFHYLEELKLVNESTSNSPPLALPQSSRLPQNLSKLTLSNTNLHWNIHMPLLASITTLKILKLKNNAFTGDSWTAERAYFEQLRFLLIKNIQLVKWTASASNFPHLRSLVIIKCTRIQRVPDGLTGNLEELEIEHVNKFLVNSARTIAEAKEREGVRFKLTLGPWIEPQLISSILTPDLSSAAGVM